MRIPFAPLLGAFGAALGLSLSSIPAIAQDAVQPQAGVSAAVYGTVQLARADAVGRRIESGEPIYLGDRITAGRESGMQIMLLDETIFTVGPRSELVIDTFVYDPATNDGRVSVTVAKGVFRFATGLVAQETPENMTVNLPFGTIGIRGTIVAGQVGADTAQIVLLGPGDEANTADRIGRIQVSGLGGAGMVEISRSGFATTLSAGAAPTPPAPLPPAQVRGLLGNLGGGDQQAGERDDAATATDGDGADGDAAADANAGTSEEGAARAATDGGTTEAAARADGAPAANGTVTGSVGGTRVTALSGDTVAGAVDSLARVETAETGQATAEETVSSEVTSAQTLGEVTTVQDLLTVTTGTGTLSGSGFALTGAGITGTFSSSGTADFANRTLKYEMSANWSGAESGSFSLTAGPSPYDEVFEKTNVVDDIASGDGFKSSNTNDDDVTFTGLDTNETADIRIRIRNGDTTVAQYLDSEVSITDNGTTITGSGTATRTD